MAYNRKTVIRPWSIGACPTAAELSAAWEARLNSPRDFIWLLSVLGELTCFTDCNLEHLGGFGHIAGRRGGLKAWLAREAPELAGKYKSISRHATLALRMKKAFALYPPAPLSLLHPELACPVGIPSYMVNYALKLWETHLRSVNPTYVAYRKAVDARMKSKRPLYRWGPALPRESWPEAERRWRVEYVRPRVLKEIYVDNWLAEKGCLRQCKDRPRW